MNIKTLAINAGAFVIPNDARILSDFNSLNAANGTRTYLLELAKLNNIELVESDKIVQLWIHSKDSDNINDHGFCAVMDGREIYVRAHKIQWVPAKMLDGINEGDSIKLISPATGYAERKAFKLNKDSDKFDIILEVSMICQQQGYRYARFGKFEEVVKNV